MQLFSSCKWDHLKVSPQCGVLLHGLTGCPSPCLQAIDRRERLRRLALETIDLSKDPYFMRNHLGQYECRLCLTLHNNEGNYLAHTQAGTQHNISAMDNLFPSIKRDLPLFGEYTVEQSTLSMTRFSTFVRLLGRASGISRTWQSVQHGRQSISQLSHSHRGGRLSKRQSRSGGQGTGSQSSTTRKLTSGLFCSR